MYLAKRFQREYKYAGTQAAKSLNIRAMWGGSEPTVIQPTPTPQPTASGSASEWAAAMPTIYNTQLQYMPKFGQLAADMQKQLYPTVAGLTENLAGQAAEGMKGNLPSDVENYYDDKLRATFGSNLMTPLGQQAYGQGMTSLREQYKNYYQNMALSLLGMNQTVQPPSYGDMTSGMTAGSVMNANANNYSTYQSAMRPIINPYANQSSWTNTLGAVGGGLAGFGSMYSAMQPKTYNYNGYMGG